MLSLFVRPTASLFEITVQGVQELSLPPGIQFAGEPTLVEFQVATKIGRRRTKWRNRKRQEQKAKTLARVGDRLQIKVAY